MHMYLTIFCLCEQPYNMAGHIGGFSSIFLLLSLSCNSQELFQIFYTRLVLSITGFFFSQIAQDATPRYLFSACIPMALPN